MADLARADHIPSAAFDCIILTQTLHLIYDVRAAIATLHRILGPGGVLLLTVPGITRISHDEWPGSWYWSFTTDSASRLFAEAFGPGRVAIGSRGTSWPPARSCTAWRSEMSARPTWRPKTPITR